MGGGGGGGEEPRGLALSRLRMHGGAPGCTGLQGSAPGAEGRQRRTVVLEVEREERHAAVPSEVLSRRASRLDHVAACGDEEWSEHRAEHALCELRRESLAPQPEPQRLNQVEQRAVRVPHLLAAGAGVRAWGWGGGEGLGGLGGPGLELGRSLPGLSGQG